MIKTSKIKVSGLEWLKNKHNLHVAMDRNKTWYAYDPDPWYTWLTRIFGKWTNQPITTEFSEREAFYNTLVIRVDVTGFTGNWKDSLHKWNLKKWEKVK
jgi:hypothetical protein